MFRERKCDLTGRRQNSKCNSVSKSGVRTHRVQHVNLQWRKIWWPEGNTFVRVRVATRTLKTIKLKGISAVAKDNGVNLRKFRISCGGNFSGSRPILKTLFRTAFEAPLITSEPKL